MPINVLGTQVQPLVQAQPAPMVGLPTLQGIEPSAIMQAGAMGAQQGASLGEKISSAIEAMTPEGKAKKVLENRIIQARLDQMDAEKEKNAYDISIRKTKEELDAEKKFTEAKRNQEFELGKVTLEDLNTRIKRFGEGIGVRHDAEGHMLPAYQEKLRLSGMTPEQIQREADKFALDGMNHQLEVKEAQSRLAVMGQSKAPDTLSSASPFTPQDKSGNPLPFLSLNPSAEVPSDSVPSQSPLDGVNSLMPPASTNLDSVPPMIRTVQSGGKLVPNPEYLRLKKENDDLDEIGRKKGVRLVGKSLEEKYAIVNGLETKKTGESKLSENEANAQLFGKQLIQSGEILDKYDSPDRTWTNFDPASINVLHNYPDWAALHAAKSNERQMYEQAKLAFMLADLRKQSGSAISATEYEGEMQRYFPRYGDGPDVIKQKNLARKLTTDTMLDMGHLDPVKTREEIIKSYGTGALKDNKSAPKVYKSGDRKEQEQGGVKVKYIFDGKTWNEVE